jgi:hypothetical protein
MVKAPGIFLGLLATANFLDAQVLSPNTNLTAREEQIIAAARPGTALPNLSRVIIGHAVTHGAELLVQKRLCPALNRAGDYPAPVRARNARGDQLALTPPMGWNSYDAFGDSVVESEVLANAAWLKEHLQPLGWDTIVVDFRWYDPEPTGDDRLLNKTRVGAALAADEFGRLLPATNRFPSATNGAGFKPLADKLHSLGLKFGIHVMRGIPRQAVAAGTKIFGGEFIAVDAGDTNDKCVWCPDMFGVRSNAAGQAWYDSCARLWAAWGVDYIKVDDLSSPYHIAEVEMLRHALDHCGRAIVFSTSPGPTPTGRAAHVAANANSWRISGDFWDKWQKLDNQFDLIAEWQGAGVPGHWPDADMIPLGYLALRSKLGGNPHWTRLTRDEQLTLMSLWALAPSPLMLGMNLPDNDDWTTALLTNPEVLAVNQDSLGRPARRMTGSPQVAETWVKELANGSVAVGFFNRTDQPVKVDFPWRNLGFVSAPEVRDLWLRKDLGRQENFTTELPPHGCTLLRVDLP